MKKLNLTYHLSWGPGGGREGGGEAELHTYVHHLKNSQVRKIPLQVINVSHTIIPLSVIR